jgi:hypothetical protein
MVIPPNMKSLSCADASRAPALGDGVPGIKLLGPSHDLCFNADDIPEDCSTRRSNTCVFLAEPENREPACFIFLARTHNSLTYHVHQQRKIPAIGPRIQHGVVLGVGIQELIFFSDRTKQL